MPQKKVEEEMRLNKKIRICVFEKLIPQWQKTISGTSERQRDCERPGGTREEEIAVEKEVRRFRDLLEEEKRWDHCWMLAANRKENNTSMKSSAQIVWVVGGKPAKHSFKYPEKKQELGITQAGFKDFSA